MSTSAYTNTAIQNVLSELTRAACPGNIDDPLFKAAARCYEFVNAGSIDSEYVEAELFRIATQAGHSEADTRKTLRSAQRKTASTVASIPGPSRPVREKHVAKNERFDDLAAYAMAQGSDLATFQAAGWSDSALYEYEYTGKDDELALGLNERPRKGQTRIRRALRFTTDAGPRYRLIDEERPKPKYWHPFGSHTGASRRWYKLSEALALAEKVGHLVLCNGEASTVVAQAAGIPAMCEAGGGEKAIPSHLLDELSNAWDGPVIVALDGDGRGRQQAPKKAAQLTAVGCDARAVDLGDGLDLANFCKLHQYDTWADLLACPDLTQAKPTSSRAPVAPGSGGAIIDITDENLGRVTAAIWAAMLASPYSAGLYRLGTEVAYRDEDGKLVSVDDNLWRGMVNRAASFVTVKTTKIGEQFSEVIPPLAMIKDSLVFAPKTLPAIDRVSPIPIFDARGQLLTTGYHADSRTLVTSDIAPVAMTPDAALDLIRDNLLVDFPFATDADRANAVAYLLLPFVREMCGAIPLFLIDAAQRGTGKTLLNDLVHTIWTGSPAPLSDLPLNAEEQRKAITTHLLGAPVSIVFDDISLLAGHAIQRAVTGQVWTDRALGTNKTIEVPIRTIWVATGNNVTLGGDMVRRTVLVRLVSLEENPSQRSGFKRTESELRTWVAENRAQLVSACTSLIAHGLAHGQAKGKAMGGFDQFARVMTRILDGIGVHGFCDNLDEVLSREDGRQSGWKAIVRTWWDTYGDTKIKAGDIASLIEKDADSEIVIDGDSPRARAITAGKLLKSKLGAVFAFEDVRLQIATSKSGKGDTVYKLAEVTFQGGNGGFTASESASGSSGSSGSSTIAASSEKHAKTYEFVETHSDSVISAISATSAMASESVKADIPYDVISAGEVINPYVPLQPPPGWTTVKDEGRHSHGWWVTNGHGLGEYHRTYEEAVAWAWSHEKPVCDHA